MPLLLMGTGKNYEPLVRAAAQRLANFGVALYPVDAKGLCRQGDSSKNEGTHGFHDSPPMVFASLDVLADVTGGRVIEKLQRSGLGGQKCGRRSAGNLHGRLLCSRSVEHRSVAASGAQHDAQGRGVATPAGLSAPQQPAAGPLSGSVENDRVRLPGVNDPCVQASVQRQGTQLAVTLRVPAAILYFQELSGAFAADLEIGLVESASGAPINVQRQPAAVKLKDDADRNAAPVVPLETTWKIDARPDIGSGRPSRSLYGPIGLTLVAFGSLVSARSVSDPATVTFDVKLVEYCSVTDHSRERWLRVEPTPPTGGSIDEVGW